MLNSKKNILNNNGNNNGLQVVENNGQIIVNNNIVKNNSETISILSKLIKNILNTQDISRESTYKKDLIPYDILEKIDYNIVIIYKQIFEKYKNYYWICDKILNTIDDNGSFSEKKIFLNYLNDLYIEIIGNFMKDEIKKIQEKKGRIPPIKQNIQIIKEKILADEIVKKIRDSLKNILNDELLEEEKNFGINILICYGFIECKILEKPKREGLK